MIYWFGPLCLWILGMLAGLICAVIYVARKHDADN